VTSTLFRVDQDLLPVILRVRDQFVHIPMNVKVEFVENHSPKEPLLESLQLIDEALPSELHEHDLA
jgi:hypothetical protein